MKKYLFNISGGHPRSLLPSIIAAILEGIVKIAPAALLVDIFNTIYRAFAHPEQGLDINRMWLVSGILCVWLVVEYAAYASLYDKTYRVAYSLAASGRLKLAEHIRHLSLGFFGKRDPGDLTNLILSDYGQIEHTISHNLSQLISAIVLPTLAFAGLMLVNWKMALAMFIAVPLGAVLLRLTDSIQSRLSEGHIRAKNEAASRLQEYLSGIREIKAHNIGGKRFERLRQAFDDLKITSIRLEAIMGPMIMGAMLLARSGLTCMILVGGYLLADGELTLPVFLLFLLIGTKVFEPLTVVLMSYGEMRYSAYSAKRIMDVQQEAPLAGTAGVQAHQRITFDQVTFGYEDQHPVLKELSFTIEPRTITALVGPSGSGKSTVTRLIARFWDVQQGVIRIGNTPVTAMNPEKLLQNISVVFQDVYLFQDTIGNNIRVGKKDATQAEIEQAARKACCHEFISSLPQGYDTLVGEGGSRLSGGEKQRISIARALLKNASIVLLDEATASLDPENEAAVQQAINELVADKTVILIAHRLKTIQNADQILVLDQGHLVEQGTHVQLLNRSGIYARLWQLQQEAEGWQVNAGMNGNVKLT
ncbi:ABC transporter ATP-binding protein [Paenibacillus barcinonensis]|uniref:ABC transporter ATP-binding protein n=1 Tax=Paenibacillus barcinonensis TaxID=198119 RepID=A0A2V4V8T1_PAEBA|nr:ABC transporter ATP-binding protein [Paenibacillus barcinonensis]PYE49071.1 ATP-binding cassette subfamily B protein [Paenibacillus barcinonensis]QKS55318.1 ABC transporter ATP-binding protein [Paenibacillus barcinonensis]